MSSGVHVRRWSTAGPRSSGLSYRCADGDHAKCSGVIGVAYGKAGEIALHPCACGCGCSRGVSLEAVAATVRERADRLGV